MTDTYNSRDHWDNLCKQCGLCCFEKLEDERGTIFYTQTACRYLDVTTRRCKIFERRFDINPSCIKLTPELVSTLHWLPSDCGYRQSTVELPLEPRRIRRRWRKGRK